MIILKPSKMNPVENSEPFAYIFPSIRPIFNNFMRFLCREKIGRALELSGKGALYSRVKYAGEDSKNFCLLQLKIVILLQSFNMETLDN